MDDKEGLRKVAAAWPRLLKTLYPEVKGVRLEYRSDITPVQMGRYHYKPRRVCVIEIAEGLLESNPIEAIRLAGALVHTHVCTMRDDPECKPPQEGFFLAVPTSKVGDYDLRFEIV